MNTTYYVYAISHKVTGKWYIGSRTKIGCHPDELFRPREKYVEGKSKGHRKGYFTSSRLVKKIIKLDGGSKNFKVESIKIFDTKDKALFCEALLHKLFDIEKDNDYLNLHNAGSQFSNAGRQVSPEIKKKISETLKGKYTDKKNPMWGMKGENNPNYGKKRSDETRRKMSEAKKGRTLSEDHKKKISKIHKGKVLSEDHKKKISKIHKGKKRSDETRKKISEALKGENNPNYGKKHSAETRKKMSDSKKGEKAPNYGKPLSRETRKKISNANKGKQWKIITCPHCNKTGGANAMKRHHFDNCKNKGI